MFQGHVLHDGILNLGASRERSTDAGSWGGRAGDRELPRVHLSLSLPLSFCLTLGNVGLIKTLYQHLWPLNMHGLEAEQLHVSLL